MKCQSLFSGKNKKYNTILSSAELTRKGIKVNNKFSLILLYRKSDNYNIWSQI